MEKIKIVKNTEAPTYSSTYMDLPGKTSDRMANAIIREHTTSSESTLIDCPLTEEQKRKAIEWAIKHNCELEYRISGVNGLIIKPIKPVDNLIHSAMYLELGAILALPAQYVGGVLRIGGTCGNSFYEIRNPLNIIKEEIEKLKEKIKCEKTAIPEKLKHAKKIEESIKTIKIHNLKNKAKKYSFVNEYGRTCFFADMDEKIKELNESAKYERDYCCWDLDNLQIQLKKAQKTEKELNKYNI